MPNTTDYRLVLDVGTTTIKALIFDAHEQIIGKATALPQKFKPQPGWVEQDPRELLELTQHVATEALRAAGVTPTIMGITNQRETVVAWDKNTGKPLYNALVWEDTRTQKHCDSLRAHKSVIQQKTGLPLDPYFSAPKISWLLEQSTIKEARAAGSLLIGTVDTWILWNSTEHHLHATDLTNASRTLLFNTRTLSWDDELCTIFAIPQEILPRVLPSQSDFGVTTPTFCGVAIPVRALCGDQQASHYAAGDTIGTTKATFGTGTFISQTIGEHHAIYPGFFTTLLPHTSHPWYGIEAKINASGVRMQAVIHDPAQRKELLTELITNVKDNLSHLPIPPKELVVDGGITNAPEFAAVAREILPIPIRMHTTSDGTALGIARLLTR